MKIKLLIIILWINFHNTAQEVYQKHKKVVDWISRTPSIVSKYFNYRNFPTDSLSIRVSAQVVPLETVFFKDHLNQLVSIKTTDTLLDKSLIEYCKVENFKPYYREELRKLSINKDAELILFFSEMKGEVLVADLIDYNGKEKDYYRITQFNTAIRFLFVFDEKGNIVKVLTTEVSFN